MTKDKIKINENLSLQKITKSYSTLSPNINLRYKITDNLSTYFTISKAYKSGGYYPFCR